MVEMRALYWLIGLFLFCGSTFSGELNDKDRADAAIQNYRDQVRLNIFMAKDRAESLQAINELDDTLWSAEDISAANDGDGSGRLLLSGYVKRLIWLYKKEVETSAAFKSELMSIIMDRDGLSREAVARYAEALKICADERRALRNDLQICTKANQ